MCKNLFKGKGAALDIGLDILGAVLLPGLGEILAPELGALTGLEVGEGLTTASDAIAGTAIGAGTSAIEGKNIAEGAAFGGVGGAIQGSGVLGQIGSAIKSGASDVGDYLGLTGASAPTDSLGVTGGIAPSAGGAQAPALGVDSLSNDFNNSLTTPPGGSTDVSGAISGNTPSVPGLSASGGASPTAGGSSFSGISSDQIGGFQNAPDAGASLSSTTGTPNVTSGNLEAGGALSSPIGTGSGTTSTPTSASGELEAGGGLNSDSALSSIQSSNASSASLFGSGPSLEAGGGITASTGVAPVSGGFFSDLFSGNFSGAGDDLSNAFQNVPAKALGPVAGMAYQAVAGQPKLPSGERALQGELQGEESTALNEYNTGVLTAPQQAQLDQSRQNMQNQLYQQFASSGITNPQADSRFQQGLQQIETQIEAQKQGFMSQAQQTGNAAATELNEIGKQQMELDKDYAGEIGDLSKSLFDILGS